MVDYNGLENRRAERHRGFESLSLRSIVLLIFKRAGSHGVVDSPFILYVTFDKLLKMKLLAFCL